MAKKRMPEHVARAVIDRAEGKCESMIPGVCTFGAHHLHHRKISGREHTVENLAHICTSCHSYVHANPAWSYERGYLVRMGHEPSVTPFQYRGLPSLLDAEGGVTYQQVGE